MFEDSKNLKKYLYFNNNVDFLTVSRLKINAHTQSGLY